MPYYLVKLIMLNLRYYLQEKERKYWLGDFFWLVTVVSCFVKKGNALGIVPFTFLSCSRVRGSSKITRSWWLKGKSKRRTDRARVAAGHGP